MKAYLNNKTINKVIVPSVWTPYSLGSSVALWLDATDAETITLNGSNVSQWDDRSGNNRHAAQSIATKQPVYVANAINGKACVKGDNTDDVLFGPLPLSRTLDYTVVMVLTAISAYDIVFDFHDSATPSTSRITNINFAVGRSSTSGISLTNTGAQSLSSPAIFAATHANSAAAGQRFDQFVNGTRSSGFPADSSAPAFTGGSFNQYAILDDITGGNAWVGGIGEYIIATGLSESDRQKLEGYLAHKWGLTANLPSDHPYKTVAP